MIALRSWSWFRSLRWGRSNPGAVLWWLCSPFGQFLIIDEYRFQYADPAEVAAEIARKDRALGLTSPARYTAAEPELWDTDRGPTIAELFSRANLPLMKSSSKRVQGWNATSALLKQTVTINGVSQPALVVSSQCALLIRLLPTLREGKADREDLDKSVDTALVESLRIGVMSRPAAASIYTTEPGEGTVGYELQKAREESARLSD